MTNLFTLLIVVSIASALGLYFIPWVGRLLTLYALHGTRDRVYQIGQQSPAICETVLYNDVLVILSTMIHLVRERRLREVIAFSGALANARANAKKQTVASDRYARDLSNVFVGEAGLKALSELLDCTTTGEMAIVLRVATGHPLLQVFACSIGFAIWLGSTLQELLERLTRAFAASPRPSVPMARFKARHDAVASSAKRFGISGNVRPDYPHVMSDSSGLSTS
jgi:hypothetical protein